MPSFWRWYTYWYLVSLALRQMAGIPQQTTFSSLYCLMKIKCFEKWSKFQHGIGYWLGAVQATNHCLNQCWHSSSTHIYVSQCDWIEYYAILWSWWSYNNRNGCVVEVAARVVTGGAEAPPVMAGAVILVDVSVSLMKSPCIHIYFIQCLTHWGRDKMAAFLQTTF